jgi:hypothetical protein
VRIGGADRRHQETVRAGRNPSRVIARQRNPPDVRLGVKWSQVQMGASKFAYTSPIGFSRAAEIHGPTASQLPGLASCPAIADPTRDIHRREQPRAIPGEQVPLGNDPLA